MTPITTPNPFLLHHGWVSLKTIISWTSLQCGGEGWGGVLFYWQTTNHPKIAQNKICVNTFKKKIKGVLNSCHFKPVTGKKRGRVS